MGFYIGQICLFPWPWAPRGWAKCDGQMFRIQEYSALFSLIGTEFGGDGRTNFALPKMTPIKTESGGDVAFFINLQGIYPSRN
jgi:microcystin-dependent protein